MISLLVRPASLAAIMQPPSSEAPAEGDHSVSQSTTESVGPPSPPPGLAPPRQLSASRRAAANQAVELLIWVVVLGAVLIFSTMWTGRRWRRRLRQAPPRPTKPDELWFLKHPPKKDS